MPTKILVVDDEPDLELLISQVFRRQVREGNLQFKFAPNGAQALQKLEQDDELDVVLTDINMPEMDGLTLLAKINERYPLIKSVVVSAYGDMANIRTALNRGAFDFVTKPIDFGDLEITLNKTIQEARVRKQAARDHDRLVALQRELDVARRIQQSILPRSFPQHRNFEILAEMMTAKEVGGDLYDFFMIDDHRLGFMIGDVSGKGVPAALFMAVSRTLLRSTALQGSRPDECLQRVNALLNAESDHETFVTIFYGILDTSTGEVSYCNAGHNPPYILRSDGRLEAVKAAGGLMLGLFTQAVYEVDKFALQSGDRLVMFTDGVTESQNPEQDDFTEARLEECLQRTQGHVLRDLMQILIGEVKAFSAGAPQADDLTVLALKYLG
ncbi:MAG: PP2C family protein-serine/threonine phosphatase [bacterium]